MLLENRDRVDQALLCLNVCRIPFSRDTKLLSSCRACAFEVRHVKGHAQPSHFLQIFLIADLVMATAAGAGQRGGGRGGHSAKTMLTALPGLIDGLVSGLAWQGYVCILMPFHTAMARIMAF